jgi:hypothetical protein
VEIEPVIDKPVVSNNYLTVHGEPGHKSQGDLDKRANRQCGYNTRSVVVGAVRVTSAGPVSDLLAKRKVAPG